MSDLIAKKQREAIREFMRKRNLKVYPWAVRAGVSEAALRAFLKGETNTMQISTLHKLAGVENTTIDDVLTGGEISEISKMELADRRSGYYSTSLPKGASRSGEKRTEGKMAVNPSVVVDATQLATEFYEQGLISKAKIKDIALEAAEIAASIGVDIVTKNLIAYLAEINKGKK